MLIEHINMACILTSRNSYLLNKTAKVELLLMILFTRYLFSETCLKYESGDCLLMSLSHSIGQAT